MLKAKQAVQAYHSALPELLAAPILEAEAEGYAEISEFSQEMFDAEMLEAFEGAMPDRAKPFKSIQTSFYYTPPVKTPRDVYAYTYTIGPEAAGGGSGDDGWDSSGGGGDWDGSDGGGTGDFDGGGYNFFVLILFGSGVIVIGRVIGRVIADYGYKILASGIDKYLQRYSSEAADQAGGLESRKGKRAKLKAALVLRLRSSSIFGWCSCCSLLRSPSRASAGNSCPISGCYSNFGSRARRCSVAINTA